MIEFINLHINYFYFSFGFILLFFYSILKGSRNDKYNKFAIAVAFHGCDYFVHILINIFNYNLDFLRVIFLLLFIFFFFEHFIENSFKYRKSIGLIVFVLNFIILIYRPLQILVINNYYFIMGLCGLIAAFEMYRRSQIDKKFRNNLLFICVFLNLVSILFFLQYFNGTIIFEFIRFLIVFITNFVLIFTVNDGHLFVRRGNMRLTLVSYMYYILIVLTLFAGFFIYENSVRYSKELLKSNVDENLELLKIKIETELRNIEQSMELINFEFVNNRKDNDFFMSLDNEYYDEILEKFSDIYDYSLLFVLDLKGDVKYSSDPELYGHNYSFRKYFKGAIKGVKGAYFAVGVTTKKRGFYVSSPIYIENKMKAIIVIKKDLDKIEKLLNPKHNLYVMNPQGIILMSSVKEHILKAFYSLPEEDKNKIIDSRQFTGVDFNSLFKTPPNEIVEYNGKNYMFRKIFLKYSGFILSILKPTNIIEQYKMFTLLILFVFEWVIIVIFKVYINETKHLYNISISEKKYKTLFENSPNMIALLDRDFKFSQVNRKFSWISGKDDESIRYENIFSYWIEEKQETVDRIKDRVLKGKIFIREIEFRSVNDDVYVLLCMLSPIDKERIIFIGVDVTEERRMEKELFEEKEKISVTLNSISEGVITVDSDKNIIFINRKALNILEDFENRIIGKKFDETIKIYKNNQIIDILKNVFKYNSVIEKNDVCLGKNKIPIQIRVSPVNNDFSSFMGAVITFRDVRKEKKIEEEMINLQKIESIGLFAAGIAHDFNNILTSVMGNISIASNIIKNSDEKIKKVLDNAQNACQNARELTMQLLTFAKGGEPNTEVVDSKNIIKETAVFSIRGTGVKLEFEMADDLMNMEVEPGKIKQVINNIIVNSCQAMNDTGKVVLKAYNEIVDKSAITHKKAGPYINISLSDNGPGIEPVNLGKIFDPYFTTKEKGSGLGLATVLSIVKKHKGYISVKSEESKGTEFIISIPATDKKVPVSDEDKLENIKISEDMLKILVMDDEEDVREIISLMLTEMGFSVDVCSSGEEVIKSLDSGEHYDLLIFDLTIRGGMGGIETIEQVRKNGHNVKCLVSTGYSHDQIMENYSNYGFDGYISKPFTISELNQKIKMVLKNERNV